MKALALYTTIIVINTIISHTSYEKIRKAIFTFLKNLQVLYVGHWIWEACNRSMHLKTHLGDLLFKDLVIV